MHRVSSRWMLVVAAFVLFLVPVAAIAAGGFDDVADDNVFSTDIAWLADAGVTKGCNPPANTEFCPGDEVTREQMAAFMHRLASNKVVDAKTAIDADNLDGKDSTAFATSGHDHDTAYLAIGATATDADKLDGMDSTAFMTNAAYDADSDGVVDSSEIKFRYAHEGFYVDIAGIVGDPVQCETELLSFDGPTMVVANGGLSLAPLGTSLVSVYGDIVMRASGATFWTTIDSAEIAETPPDGTGAAAVPVMAAFSADAGTYEFAIASRGDDIQTNNPDYYMECVLTITAYTGLGDSASIAAAPAGTTSAGASADS